MNELSSTEYELKFSDVELKFPHVSVPWNDGEYTRKHLFIQMLSGMDMNDFTGPDGTGPPVISGGKLRMKIRVNDVIFNPQRLFNHGEIKSECQFKQSSGLHAAYSTAVNSHMGKKKDTLISLNIPVPPGGFEFTPKRISGHLPYVPIIVPEIDAKGDETTEKAFIMLFDLYIPRSEETFVRTMRKSRSPKGRNRTTLG